MAGDLDVLAMELAAVTGLLSRADAMCSMLLGLSGAGLVFTLTAISGATGLVERMLLVAAALTWAAAALVLLWAVRPRFGRSGFCRWALMDAQAAQATAKALDPGRHTASELVFSSRRARGKFTAIRLAVDLMASGLLAVAIAILAGALT